ncbi:MAG TPA: hypothetical protein VIJ35_10150 [Bradyrhizobium sp.]
MAPEADTASKFNANRSNPIAIRVLDPTRMQRLLAAILGGSAAEAPLALFQRLPYPYVSAVIVP